MIHSLTRVFFLAFIALAIVGCNDRKEDILKKSENATTRDQLRAAIGDPDDINKLGPIETWTYDASNGRVTFTFAGDTVTLKTASSNSD